MRRNYLARLIKIAALFILAYEVTNMPALTATTPSWSDSEGFSITRLGGHQFGTNGIAVQLSGKIRVGVSDAIDKEFNGAGVIDNQLSPDDVKLVKKLYAQLCELEGKKSVSRTERIDPPTLYSVMCIKDGAKNKHRGRLDELPDDLSASLDQFYLKSHRTYMFDGRAIAKLDVKVESVVREKGKFLISIRFTNGGDFPMTTISPNHWSGIWGDSLLWVRGKSLDGSNQSNFDLSGLPLVNMEEFSGETVTIPQRNSVTYKFLVMPSDKVKAGTYSFNALVFMDVGGEGPVASMGKVDFHSDYKNPTKVTIDRDYPSTPEEWKDYEARKAKEVAPVTPGAAIIEPGFYRAASFQGRAPFVKELKAGPDSPRFEDSYVKWYWEADTARDVTCQPGEACPREGRWVLRSKDFSFGGKGDRTHPQHERLTRAGESRPVVAVSDVDSKNLYWAWVAHV
ncbi:hypothetical protein [Caballeronia cordobensis]|uniref:hypothetical protein n=1 Tax=Caballeronia cordobensis TaxID=1353886 RepID=UPI00045F0379|nr:putative uncharacterized protein [Burkholderia sp. RPE67]